VWLVKGDYSRWVGAQRSGKMETSESWVRRFQQFAGGVIDYGNGMDAPVGF
jgi:hypothetical protein